MKNIIFNSELLHLSQSEDGTKLFGKVLVCPLDVGNSNGKGIKKDDITDDDLERLIGQPIVCKVIKNSDGFDFGSHEMKKIKEYNSETQKIETKVTFDTNPIGYFTKCYIEELELPEGNKDCIVADVTFWTRYENAMSALVKLFDDGNLSTSWELYPKEKYKENGVEWLVGITWIGVALLGKKITPAYKDAGVLELSEMDESELELTEAFTKDILNEKLQTSSNEEDSNINKNVKGGNDDMDKNTEIASVSLEDLYTKVRKAINSIDSEKYYYVAFVYPLEFRAIAYHWSRESDSDFIEFKYSVNSDETISITGQTSVKMVFMPQETMEATIAEKDSKIKELEGVVSEKDTLLSEKVDAITKLGEELSSKDEVIKEKDTEISSLQPYKEQIEAAEKVKQEAEIAEKKESLKKLAIKGGYISSEEVETSEEIKTLIDSLNENGIKTIIAERVIAKLDEKKEDVEVSENTKVEETKTPTINLNSDATTSVDYAGVMSKFLSK